jgi:hypothetical protein
LFLGDKIGDKKNLSFIKFFHLVLLKSILKFSNWKAMISAVYGKAMVLAFNHSATLNFFPEFVLESPSKAALRIFHYYQQYPSVDRNNIAGTVAIWDLLYQQGVTREQVNCLSVIAPHTHWESDQPVIYCYEELAKKYVIGQHKVVASKKYFPVSFVLGGDQPISFE